MLPRGEQKSRCRPPRSLTNRGRASLRPAARISQALASTARPKTYAPAARGVPGTRPPPAHAAPGAHPPVRAPVVGVPTGAPDYVEAVVVVEAADYAEAVVEAADYVEALAEALAEAFEAPVDAAPVDAAPVDAAPVDAAPVDAAPVDAAPVDAAPVDAAPVDAAPVDAAPSEPAESTTSPRAPPARRRRLALCIGINYNGQSAQLRGCVNDALALADVLRGRFGFDVQLMTDDTSTRPTRAALLSSLHTLMAASRGGDVDEVFVSFSGHGNMLDLQGCRCAAPGQNEVLVPVDYATDGYLVDDDLHAILAGAGCRVTLLIDACHSGSILKLRYRYAPSGVSVVDNPLDGIDHPIMCLSGCDDRQTSADAFAPEANRYQGAMTTAFLHILEAAGYRVTCKDVLRNVQARLREQQYYQVPQLSSSTLVPDSQHFLTTA